MLTVALFFVDPHSLFPLPPDSRILLLTPLLTLYFRPIPAPSDDKGTLANTPCYLFSFFRFWDLKLILLILCSSQTTQVIYRILIITSRVSSRGNRIGLVCVRVCVCVCLSICNSAVSWLNSLMYGHKIFWYGDAPS